MNGLPVVYYAYHENHVSRPNQVTGFINLPFAYYLARQKPVYTQVRDYCIYKFPRNRV